MSTLRHLVLAVLCCVLLPISGRDDVSLRMEPKQSQPSSVVQPSVTEHRPAHPQSQEEELASLRQQNHEFWKIIVLQTAVMAALAGVMVAQCLRRR